jgi:Endonuclease NucS
LGDRMLIIARQESIEGIGKLDLLGIDQNGALIIIELKRDRTPREAIAQALDYASWLHSAEEAQIKERAEKYLKQPLKEKFCEYFDVEELPEPLFQEHRVILVAPRIDASAERIITFLRDQYGIGINAVFFEYARLSGGNEVLARAMLVPEEFAVQPKTSRQRANEDGLIKMATENGTQQLVDVCREVGEWWEEEAVTTFDGSFRFWGESEAGQDRMVFGVNVAAKAKPPNGQLDVWIPAASLAEVTGRPETEVRSALQKQPIVNIQMGRKNPRWIRLKTEEEARALIQQLRDFNQKAPVVKI